MHSTASGSELNLTQDGNIKVSLVVPMYNCEDYVSAVLDNLCAQSFRDIEIICLLDGPTDKTRVLAETHAESDSRIRVVLQDHRGAGAARNRGLDEAGGEYLMFCDVDDDYSLDYVAKMYAAVSNSNADIAVCQIKRHDYHLGKTDLYCGYKCILHPKNKPITPSSIKNFTDAISHLTLNKIIRRGLISDNNIRFSETASINDIFFSTAALICAKSVVLIDDHLVTYNMHRNPMSISSLRSRSPQNVLTVYRQLYSWLEERGLVDKMLSDYCLKWSNTLREYAKLSKGDALARCVARELAESEPWKSMSERQLRKRSQLFSGVARHNFRIIGKRLRSDRLSEAERASLEYLFSYAERESHILSEIVRILRDDYGKDMRDRDNYLTARMVQVGQYGFRGTLQIVLRKFLNLHHSS